MQYRKRMLRKKGTALLLSALLLASALPLAAYAEEVSAKTTEYVNFRSGPGTNYSSQGIIASGTTITVTDTSNSEWYAVRLSNGSTGYIYAEYISMSTGGSTSNGEERSAKTTEYVNFRSGPGTNYNSKGVIALGTTVTVTDTSNAQWYAVRLSNGSTGYIDCGYRWRHGGSGGHQLHGQQYAVCYGGTYTGAIQRFRADRKNDRIRKLPFRPRYELQF